eukprot:1852226-Pyramimonas_sp.AAC.2
MFFDDSIVRPASRIQAAGPHPSCSRLQAWAMFTAVSSLSPVSIQILSPASCHAPSHAEHPRQNSEHGAATQTLNAKP